MALQVGQTKASLFPERSEVPSPEILFDEFDVKGTGRLYLPELQDGLAHYGCNGLAIERHFSKLHEDMPASEDQQCIDLATFIKEFYPHIALDLMVARENALESYVWEEQKRFNKAMATMNDAESRALNKRPTVTRAHGEFATARVFISSTFTDTFNEREVLVKRVMPLLKRRCENIRVIVFEIDLRWGLRVVDDENARVQYTVNTCLGELDRCIEENGEPFFLGVLSERCGWVIPSEKMSPEQIERWKWEDGFTITTMEAVHGALRRRNPNAFFALRCGDFLKDPVFCAMNGDNRARFVEMEGIATLAQSAHGDKKQGRYRGPRDLSRVAKLHVLKERIREMYGSHGHVLDPYRISIGPKPRFDYQGQLRLDGLEVFGEWSESKLWGAIESQYPVPPAPIGIDAPLLLDRACHDTFRDSQCSTFHGRGGLLSRICELAADAASRSVPILVTGQSGSGKSALVAAFARLIAFHANKCNTASKWVAGSGSGPNIRIPGEFKIASAVTHFAGAGRGSNDISSMVRRLTLELVDRFNLPSSEKPTTERATLAELCGNLSATLEHAAEKESGALVVCIDGVDQMQPNDAVAALQWLPKMPDASTPVLWVVGCARDSGAAGLLKALRGRSTTKREVNVTTLSSDDQLAIVQGMLANHAKALDTHQLDKLMGKKSSTGPLFLMLTCRELLCFGIFEQVTAKIQGLKDSVHGMLSQVFQRLENEHGLELVRDTLSLIARSRDGLMELELRELLARNGAERLPDAQWSALCLAAESFLRPAAERRAADGFVTFIHREVMDSVKARYLSSTDAKQGPLKYSEMLANYFKSKAEEETRRADLHEYPRALRELAFYQREAGLPHDVVVAVRARPVTSIEWSKGARQAVQVLPGAETRLLCPKDGTLDSFRFDFCFSSGVGSGGARKCLFCDKFGVPKCPDHCPTDNHWATDSSQSTVYHIMGEEAATDVFDGRAVTMFAYGQTGSGKTHTIFGNLSGNHEQEGIVPRLCRDILRRTAAASTKILQYDVSVSMFEIYLEKVFDLLKETATGTSPEPLKVQQEANGKVRVVGLSEIGVTSWQEAMTLLSRGGSLRTVRATGMNEHSSRAHTIFTLKVKQRRRSSPEDRWDARKDANDPSELWSGCINLVDLAGSERMRTRAVTRTGAAAAKAGEAEIKAEEQTLLKQGVAINKSLTVLNRCVVALAGGTKEVANAPFRDSTLTWILKDQLSGGNGRVVVLATVSVTDAAHPETLGTLRYASISRSMDVIGRKHLLGMHDTHKGHKGGASPSATGAGGSPNKVGNFVGAAANHRGNTATAAALSIRKGLAGKLGKMLDDLHSLRGRADAAPAGTWKALKQVLVQSKRSDGGQGGIKMPGVKDSALATAQIMEMLMSHAATMSPTKTTSGADSGPDSPATPLTPRQPHAPLASKTSKSTPKFAKTSSVKSPVGSSSPANSPRTAIARRASLAPSTGAAPTNDEISITGLWCSLLSQKRGMGQSLMDTEAAAGSMPLAWMPRFELLLAKATDHSATLKSQWEAQRLQTGLTATQPHEALIITIQWITTYLEVATAWRKLYEVGCGSPLEAQPGLLRVAQLLRANEHVWKLHRMGLDDSATSVIAQVVSEQDSGLAELDISGNKMTTEGLKAFEEAIQVREKTRSGQSLMRKTFDAPGGSSGFVALLDVRHNDLDVHSASPIMQLLSSSMDLRIEFTIDNFPLPDQEVQIARVAAAMTEAAREAATTTQKNNDRCANALAHCITGTSRCPTCASIIVPGNSWMYWTLAIPMQKLGIHGLDGIWGLSAPPVFAPINYLEDKDVGGASSGAPRERRGSIDLRERRGSVSLDVGSLPTSLRERRGSITTSAFETPLDVPNSPALRQRRASVMIPTSPGIDHGSNGWGPSSASGVGSYLGAPDSPNPNRRNSGETSPGRLSPSPGLTLEPAGFTDWNTLGGGGALGGSSGSLKFVGPGDEPDSPLSMAMAMAERASKAVGGAPPPGGTSKLQPIKTSGSFHASPRAARVLALQSGPKVSSMSSIVPSSAFTPSPPSSGGQSPRDTPKNSSRPSGLLRTVASTHMMRSQQNSGRNSPASGRNSPAVGSGRNSPAVSPRPSGMVPTSNIFGSAAISASAALAETKHEPYSDLSGSYAYVGPRDDAITSFSLGLAGCKHAFEVSKDRDPLSKEKGMKKCLLGDIGCVVMGVFLRDKVFCRDISHVVLRGHFIGNQGAVCIANALKDNPTITSLDLRGNRIGDDGASALVSVVRDRRIVERLDLERNPISDAVYGRLLAGLCSVVKARGKSKSVVEEPSPTLLRHLSASGTMVRRLLQRMLGHLCEGGEEAVSDAECHTIAAYLQWGGAVTSLSICSPSDSGLLQLAKGIEENKTLEDLQLYKVKVGSPDVPLALGNAVVKSKSLDMFCVGDNGVPVGDINDHCAGIPNELVDIGDVGSTYGELECAVLGALLRENRCSGVLLCEDGQVVPMAVASSVVLDIKGKAWNGAELHLVSNLIRVGKPNCISVNISGNDIDDAACASLCSSMLLLPSVQSFVATACGITDSGANEVASLVARSRTLASVDLRGNPIGDAGAKALLKAAKGNTNVVTLHVDVVCRGVTIQRSLLDEINQLAKARGGESSDGGGGGGGAVVGGARGRRGTIF